MITKNEHITYPLNTPFNYTGTNLANHKTNVNYDVVSDFSRQERLTPSQLWSAVHPYSGEFGNHRRRQVASGAGRSEFPRVFEQLSGSEKVTVSCAQLYAGYLYKDDPKRRTT